MGTGYSLIRALTERKHSQLYHLAHHDVLTGLANRHHFDESLVHALASAELSTTQVGLLFVDLDRFKTVNDTYGHSVGDALLKAVADRMKTCVRSGDTVTRLSGDEFAIILPGVSGSESVLAIARTLVDTLAEAFFLEGYELRISCSLGVAVYPHHALTPQKLLQCADAAAYHAKQIRNTFQLYTPDMVDAAAPAICTYTTLRTAIESDQLQVHYQPKIDLRSGRIIGVEALVRWPHPTEGFIAAGDIVHVAEETGLMVPLTEWVLRTACLQTLAWQAHAAGGDDGGRAAAAGDQRVGRAVQAEHAGGTGAARARCDGPADGVPGDRADRIRGDAPRAVGHGDAARAEGDGYPRGDRRFRHGIFVAQLSAAAAGGFTEDRSLVRASHRAEPEGIGAGEGDHHDGAQPGSARDRGRCRDVGPARWLRRHGCDEVQGYVFCPPMAAEETTQFLQDAAEGDLEALRDLPRLTNRVSPTLIG